MSTSSLFEVKPEKPREATDQVEAETRATCSPGAMARASGTVVTPERRISSWVMTNTAAGASLSRCSFLATEVTVMFISWARSISRYSLPPVGAATTGPGGRRTRSRATAGTATVRIGSFLVDIFGERTRCKPDFDKRNLSGYRLGNKATAANFRQISGQRRARDAQNDRSVPACTPTTPPGHRAPGEVRCAGTLPGRLKRSRPGLNLLRRPGGGA